MSKYSIYPDSIDGYAQLPLVVDKLTKIDAVTVNRLRSAILNIEKELGIKPSGSFSSVRERLDSLRQDVNNIVDLAEGPQGSQGLTGNYFNTTVWKAKNAINAGDVYSDNGYFKYFPVPSTDQVVIALNSINKDGVNLFEWLSNIKNISELTTIIFSIVKTDDAVVYRTIELTGVSPPYYSEDYPTPIFLISGIILDYDGPSLADDDLFFIDFRVRGETGPIGPQGPTGPFGGPTGPQGST
ncbi:MAG: collagen-like protein, partial [Alphaproteobacteria bacterium]|nr:collagen-like protein [Alphaproteobacteria bacterium]